jgi:hypothetical protein
MDVCETCQRPMRPKGVSKADAPDTVARVSAVMCVTCYAAQHRTPGQVQPGDDNPCVQVRSLLRPSTFKVLLQFANAHNVEVGVVLSKLADNAVSHDRTAKRFTGSGKSKTELADVREWAARAGYVIGARGRIPRPVLDAYDAAHQNVAA